jgi:hypothetical protein
MEQGIARVPERRTATAEGKRRHGDAAIAGALGYFASQTEVGEIAYQPVPRVRPFDEASAEAIGLEPANEPDNRLGRRARFGLHSGTW